LPTLPEAVDEQHIECGVVLTQPSQETQDDLDADEPIFIVSNETLFNVWNLYPKVWLLVMLLSMRGLF
jgi:hypothetical protein